MINVWGYSEILPFILFCFSDMLNNGISSILWAPFSLKARLGKKLSYVSQTCTVIYSEQSSFQVNFLVQEDHESSTIDAGLLLGTKTIRDKHLNKSSNRFVKSSILGALTCSWKLSRTFILTQLTSCSVSEDEQFSVSFSKFHSNCAFSRISKCIL